MAFLRQVGYVEVVNRHLPFRLTSPNALDRAQTFTAFLLAVLVESAFNFGIQDKWISVTPLGTAVRGFVCRTFGLLICFPTLNSLLHHRIQIGRWLWEQIAAQCTSRTGNECSG